MAQLLALAAALLPLLFQAKDNLEYTFWSEHKTGSWVKIKMEMEAQGAKVVIEAQHTLLELATDKAVVEQKNKVTLNGAAQPDVTEKAEIFKDKDKDKNPITVEKEGDEEIEVAGKKLKCHWVEGPQKDMTRAKLWLHKDIPGGIAKGEISGGELPGKMTLAATAWEKK
jgi:hypothetical protein